MPKRILVVEDDPDHRRIVTKVLAREGYDVIEAATGAAAVAAAREDRPDLIIMDLALPGLDGFEASRRDVMHTYPSLAGHRPSARWCASFFPSPDPNLGRTRR